MWPHRLCQKLLKQLIFLAAIAGVLLVIFLKTGLHDIVLSGLEDRLIADNLLRPEIWMVSPAPGEYQLQNPSKSDYSRGQCRIIDDLLGGKVNGYFVDIGAGDGETNSVSLYFEKERKWQGVLVESNTTKHRLSALKNRHSQLWNFRVKVNKQYAVDAENDITPNRLFELINRPIDLLIVNMNGFESDLINNIDFAKYYVQVITIELQNDVSQEKYFNLTDILMSHGYMVAHHLINSSLGKKDVMYKKN